MKRLTSKAMRDYHTFNGLRSITFIEGPLYKTVSLLFPAGVELVDTLEDALIVKHIETGEHGWIKFGCLMLIHKDGKITELTMKEFINA